MNKQLAPMRVLSIILTLLFATGWYDTSAAQSAGPAAHTVSILFIGNSYTFANDLPGMVAKIAASDPGNPTTLDTSSVIVFGAPLKKMWNESNAKSVIESKHWDYVVLQNLSWWELYPSQMEEFHVPVSQFGEVIKQAGAKPVMYETWMKQPTLHTGEEMQYIKTSDEMHKLLHDIATTQAKAIDADVVAVGDVWAGALAQRPSLPLYAEDGSHPSPLGTYLGALMFYHYFTHQSVDGATYVPQGVDAADAAFVKAFVAAHP